MGLWEAQGPPFHNRGDCQGPDTWTTQKLAATVLKLNLGIEAHSDRE